MSGIHELIISALDGLLSHSLRREAALMSGGTAADTSVSHARRQPGEQAVLTLVVGRQETNLPDFTGHY